MSLQVPTNRQVDIFNEIEMDFQPRNQNVEIRGDAGRLQELQDATVIIINAAEPALSHLGSTEAPPPEKREIRLINEPQLGRFDKLKNAYVKFSGPVCGFGKLVGGFFDPTGIANVAIDILHGGSILLEKGSNHYLHKKWVKQIDPSADAGVAPLSRRQLKDEFSRAINQIIYRIDENSAEKINSEETKVDRIKLEFGKLGMSIEHIQTKEELIYQLTKSKFKNKLLKEYKFHRDTSIRATAQLERSRARFDEIVEDLTINQGYSQEDAIERAYQIQAQEGAQQNTHKTLVDSVKKIHKLHSKLLKFRVIKQATELGTDLAFGLTGVALKIAGLAGVSAPVVFALSIPLSAIPIAVKAVGEGVHLALLAKYRPETSREVAMGTELKLTKNKIQMEWHNWRYHVKAKQMNNEWNKIARKEKKLEKEVNKQTVKSDIKAVKIRGKIHNHQLKIERFEDEAFSRMNKVKEADSRILDLQKVMIEAGWSDAQRYLKLNTIVVDDKKIGFTDHIAEWLLEGHRNETLDPTVRSFLQDKMAIDIDAIQEAYPDQTHEALSFHIKEFFAKDEGQMLDLIRSQRRIQRKLAKAG